MLKRSFSKQEKADLISALLPELALLRTRADISQGDLANLIGVSRQSYGAIERQSRKLTWNTYLSLVLYFDYNQKTHDFFHSMKAFPSDLFKNFNDGIETADYDFSSFIGADEADIMSKLDDQAKRSIKTMIMVEYARCTKMPGDDVVRFFDGGKFLTSRVSEEKKAATRAIKNIKGKKQ